MGVLAPAAPAAAGPVLLSAPALDTAGRTLTTDDGSWLPAGNTYAYSWQRCDEAVTSCAPVPGRTANTYLLTTADIGERIRSVVAATNSLLGATVAASSPTDPIVASPPLNVTPPAVTGGASTLTSTLGAWSDPSPASVVYYRQWQRCSGGGELICESVSGQVGVTYALTQADEGKFIRVVVSAEGLGKASVASAPLGPIPPRPGPVGGRAPTGPGGETPTSPLRKLRPFPRVIIAGRLARGLTFISGLVVRRGPRGSNVTVTCRGRGCPRARSFRGKLNRSGSLQLKRFQRIYGPGAVIEIRITKRGAIGKFTRLGVRARRVPARRDACLMPGISKPRRCP